MFGICNLSIVPLRGEPSHRSEMVSQVLFGEHFEMLDTLNEWIKIRMAYDGYIGWILQSQCIQISMDDYNFLQKAGAFVTTDLVQLLVSDPTVLSIVMGSALPFYENGSCRINDKKYLYDGKARYPEESSSSQMIVENAYMYLNAPYLWGGRTPFGIDCSGFTQMVYKLSGHDLLRDAFIQAGQGTQVNLPGEAQPGDLAFFDNEEGKITHVGILTSPNKIIHASGRVRIDAFDHHGIFNAETKRYSHNLRMIKRIL